jgi:hypothetical protein
MRKLAGVEHRFSDIGSEAVDEEEQATGLCG